MKTEKDIKTAIARSVSHNEIVMCPVQSLGSGPRAVEQYALVEDYCECELPNFEYRIIDVWGKTYEDAEFRLYLFAPDADND